MDIQSFSVNMNQNRVQYEAAVQAQAMAISNIRDISADLALLMESAQAFTDPALGNYIDMYA